MLEKGGYGAFFAAAAGAAAAADTLITASNYGGCGKRHRFHSNG